MDYGEYIQSEKWNTKADRIKGERGNKCQVCGISAVVKTLHVHHNTYLRLGDEDDNDLVVLCEDCHELFHRHGKDADRTIRLSSEKIKQILLREGITYTNTDPWGCYCYGKQILWELSKHDYAVFQEYNKANIEIVDIACMNERRREFKQALKSDYYYGMSEYQIRCQMDYWEGWKGEK